MLDFGDVTLVIAPNWRKLLRTSNTYHIEIVSPSEYPVIRDPLPGCILMVHVPASGSDLWQAATGTVLQTVEVFGLRESPQAIRLEFQSTSVVVSIGSSASEPVFGDADEILVASGAGWDALPKLWSEEWYRQWAS